MNHGDRPTIIADFMSGLFVRGGVDECVVPGCDLAPVGTVRIGLLRGAVLGAELCKMHYPDGDALPGRPRGGVGLSRIGMAPVSSRSETLHLFPARTSGDGYFPVALCGRTRPYPDGPADPMPMGDAPIPVPVALRRCRSCLLALDTQTRRTATPCLDT